MRSFTRDHAPGGAHTRRAIQPEVMPVGALDHNVGACGGGCGGTGLLGGGSCCSVCGPGGKAMSPGGASAARLLMNLFPNAASMLAAINTGIGARGNDGMVSGEQVVTSVTGRELPCTPYQDAVRDCLCMTELPSQRVVAASA